MIYRERTTVKEMAVTVSQQPNKSKKTSASNAYVFPYTGLDLDKEEQEKLKSVVISLLSEVKRIK